MRADKCFLADVAFETRLFFSCEGCSRAHREETKRPEAYASGSPSLEWRPGPVAVNRASGFADEGMTMGGNCRWMENVRDLSSRQKERAVNAVNNRIVRDILALQNMPRGLSSPNLGVKGTVVVLETLRMKHERGRGASRFPRQKSGRHHSQRQGQQPGRRCLTLPVSIFGISSQSPMLYAH